MKVTEFNWEEIFKDSDYFYFSGVTPSISDELNHAALEACQYCKDHEILVVCDLNYQGKMWSPEKAQTDMGKIMEYVTICIAHDEDFEASLGIKAFGGNDSRGLNKKNLSKRR